MRKADSTPAKEPSPPRREYLTPRTGLARPRATTTNATGLWEAKRAGRAARSTARAQVAASVRTLSDRTHHPHPPAQLPDPSAVLAARTPCARLAAGPRPEHPPRRQSSTETVLRLFPSSNFRSIAWARGRAPSFRPTRALVAARRVSKLRFFRFFPQGLGQASLSRTILRLVFVFDSSVR